MPKALPDMVQNLFLPFLWRNKRKYSFHADAESDKFPRMRPDLYPYFERALKSRGISHFEVYGERLQSRHFEAKDGAIEADQEAVEEGLALRVFQDGRSSFAYSTDLSDGGLDYLCQSATASLPFIDSDPDLPLPTSPAATSDPDLKNFDKTLEGVSESRKRELALILESTAKAYDPKVKHVRSASYDEKILEVRLFNSAGLDRSFRRTRCQIGVMAVAEAGSDAEGAYEFDSSPFFETLDPRTVGEAASRLALSYLGATTPKSRRGPVLLDPLVAGEILEVLAGSFQGEAIAKQRSYLQGKLGQKIYSSLLNIRDEALLPGAAASAPFDGEGMDSRDLNLVEAGVVSAYLLDRLYGRKLGLTPNASLVRRGIMRPPYISYSNLRIPPGSATDEELFREVGSGLLVTEVFGMHAANPVTGDFSVGIQGFAIEGGEKRGCVKKLALAGNLHQMMADIRAVGSRFRSHGNVGAPTLVIQEMAIGGA